MTITVIVLTYNRSAILRLCLEHLEAQRYKDFEVIVVNDGSTDDTEAVLSAFLARASLRLRVLTQKNSGPAKGRNVAIAEARTDLCVLIGDDIIVSPDFLETHLRLHCQRPEPHVVGLGVTRWDTTHQHLTPFMKWVERWQFDYERLLAGAEPSWYHFYTSNLSFKTETLRANKFSEQYTKYGYSDIELGYRLANMDRLCLVFIPDAQATHVHPTTFRDAARRMRSMGYSLHLFHTQWPELRRGEKPAKLRDRARRFLAAHPPLLNGLTDFVDRLWGERRHTVLSALLLGAHHRRGYMDFDAAHRFDGEREAAPQRATGIQASEVEALLVDSTYTGKPDMDGAAICEFIRRQRYGVVSSTASNGSPQSALVGIASTSRLEIIFDTLNSSRKYINLTQRPVCSLVIGRSGEQTLQVEGIAEELKGDDLRRFQEVYFAQWPECREHTEWPGITYFVVHPHWMRYSDYKQKPLFIQEVAKEALVDRAPRRPAKSV